MSEKRLFSPEKDRQIIILTEENEELRTSNERYKRESVENNKKLEEKDKRIIELENELRKYR